MPWNWQHFGECYHENPNFGLLLGSPNSHQKHHSYTAQSHWYQLRSWLLDSPMHHHISHYHSLLLIACCSARLLKELLHWVEESSHLRHCISHFQLGPLSPQDFSLGVHKAVSGDGYPLWNIPISRCHLCTSCFLLAVSFQPLSK